MKLYILVPILAICISALTLVSRAGHGADYGADQSTVTGAHHASHSLPFQPKPGRG